MSSIDALKSAAAMTQRFWGIRENLGTWEKDKLADIIAVPREPTADITATKRVFRHEEGRNEKSRKARLTRGSALADRYIL